MERTRGTTRLSGQMTRTAAAPNLTKQSPDKSRRWVQFGDVAAVPSDEQVTDVTCPKEQAPVADSAPHLPPPEAAAASADPLQANAGVGGAPNNSQIRLRAASTDSVLFLPF